MTARGMHASTSRPAGAALALAAIGAQAAPPRYTVKAMPLEPQWDSSAKAIAGDFIAGSTKSADGFHEVAVLSNRRGRTGPSACLAQAVRSVQVFRTMA